MKFNVTHIAKLANLSLTKDEEMRFTSQLSDTLSYIEMLEEIDTTDVQPTSHVTGMENITRDDIAAASLTQDEVTANASSIHNGLFKVRAILDNE